MKRANICLVGCGGMASFYRHRYTQVKTAKLVMLIDKNIETAKKAAGDLGVSDYSDNFNDALRDDIDIVDISTPNFLHREQAVKAMLHNKAVLLQKPIAPTLEDARAILETAEKTGCFCGVYMSMLDSPLYWDMMGIVAKGLIGDVVSVYCRGAHTGGLTAPADGWRKSLEKTGGGALIQLAIHQINMASRVLSKKITRAAAFSKNRMCKNIGGDDVTNCCIEFENGVLGTVEASYCSELNILTIYGSRGFISAVNDTSVTLKLCGSYKGRVISYTGGVENAFCPSIYDLYKTENPFDQHISFINAYLNGEKAEVDIKESYYDLAVIKAIYKSADEQKFVNVQELL